MDPGGELDPRGHRSRQDACARALAGGCGRGGPHQPEGSWSPARQAFVARSSLPVYQRQLFRAPVRGEDSPNAHVAGRTVHEDESVRLWTLEQPGLDDVLILSIRTKVHAIGPGVIAGLLKGVELAEKDFSGLVIWSPDEPFSYGADLQAMMPTFMAGGAKALEPVEKALQDAMLRLRYAQVPTIAAVSGMALGGGYGMAVHIAHAGLQTWRAILAWSKSVSD